MIVDRDANNLHTVVGSVVQANHDAPDGMAGILGVVLDKGPYGVTMACPSPEARTEKYILTWDQEDYIGQSQTRREQ